jgi:hypothetical protein
MIIIGCDFHPSWQQISWLDKDTGETAEQKLVHASGEARKFYQQLGAPALIGMEATGNCLRTPDRSRGRAATLVSGACVQHPALDSVSAWRALRTR